MPATLTLLNPTSAKPLDGLTLTGTGFVSGAVVSYTRGSLTATDSEAVVVSSTQMTSIIPDVLQGAAGVVDVKVTNPGEAASGALALTLAAWPVEEVPVPLCSLRSVKQELGVALTDTSRDREMSAAIAGASAAIARRSRCLFRVATVTDLLDGDGSVLLVLKKGPVYSVSAVAIKGVALSAAELALVKISGIDMVVRDGAVWPAGFANISITYSAGYAVVPQFVVQACVLQAIHLLNTGPKTGVASEGNTVSGTQTTYSQAPLCKAALDLLKDIVRARVAVL